MRLEEAALRAAWVRDRVPSGESVAETVALIIAKVREDGDIAVTEMEGEFGEWRRRAAGLRRRARRRAGRTRPRGPGRPGGGDRQRARGRRGRARHRSDGDAAAGPDRRPARGPGSPRRRLRAQRAQSLSLDGRHGRDHRAGRGRRRGLRRHRAAPHDPGRGAAVRGRRRVRDDRRAGRRGVRLRERHGPARGRDRRPGQPLGAGGQAPGVRRRRDRRLRRAVRPDGDRHRRRGRSRRSSSICRRRPSTARAR